MKTANPKEVVARAHHHAKGLLGFVKFLYDMLVPAPKMEFHKTRVRFKNKNGTYVLKGWQEDGEYVGVKLKKLYGDKESFKLRLEL